MSNRLFLLESYSYNKNRTQSYNRMSVFQAEIQKKVEADKKKEVDELTASLTQLQKEHAAAKGGQQDTEMEVMY